MNCQATIEVSVLLVELMTKLTPAVIVPTDKVPGVPPAVVSDKIILSPANTSALETVRVPATNVAEPVNAPVLLELTSEVVGFEVFTNEVVGLLVFIIVLTR